MPYATVDNTRLFYRLEGRDDAPTLVLAHSLGVDHSLWDQQALDLVPHFRILRFDWRGHGASDTPPGDYSIERLGFDVLALADSLDIKRFAYCGISIGGFVGQWLEQTPAIASRSWFSLTPLPMLGRHRTGMRAAKPS